MNLEDIDKPEEGVIKQFPFPLTPQEQNAQKEDMQPKLRQVKAQSTWNSKAQTIDFLGPHVPDP